MLFRRHASAFGDEKRVVKPDCDHNPSSPIALTHDIRISDLLERHDAYSGGLAFALGDSYLRHRLPAYQRIAAMAKALGAQFDAGDNAVTRGYRAWSYMSIPFLVENKVIPYTDNITALRLAAEKAPGLTLPFQSLQKTLAQNNLHHETAHVVGHLLLETSDIGAHLEAPLQNLAHIALSEAMAVSVSVMCATDITPHDDFTAEFFVLNGLPPSVERVAPLQNAHSDIGGKEAFIFVALGAALRALAFEAKTTALNRLVTFDCDEPRRGAQWRCLTVGNNSTNFSVDALGPGYLDLHDCADVLSDARRQLRFGGPFGRAIVNGVHYLCDAFFADTNQTSARKTAFELS